MAADRLCTSMENRSSIDFAVLLFLLRPILSPVIRFCFCHHSPLTEVVIFPSPVSASLPVDLQAIINTGRPDGSPQGFRDIYASANRELLTIISILFAQRWEDISVAMVTSKWRAVPCVFFCSSCLLNTSNSVAM